MSWFPRLPLIDPDVDALARIPHVVRVRARSLAAVGVGGALGTTARWALGEWLGDAHLALLVVNLVGALLLGMLLEVLSAGPDHGGRRLIRLGLGTGLLGSFTTYSAFAVASVRIGEADVWAGFAYACLSIVGGALATLVGIAVAGLGRRA